MQQESSKKIFTIPNLLSFFRILLIPLMWYLYVTAHEPGWTVAVLALSGLSDLVDGKIARKYHMTSDLGKVLDPIADKLTQVTLVVCLISRHRQLCYVLALQIVKELTMAGAGLLVLKRTKQVCRCDPAGQDLAPSAWIFPSCCCFYSPRCRSLRSGC